MPTFPTIHARVSTPLLGPTEDAASYGLTFQFTGAAYVTADLSDLNNALLAFDNAVLGSSFGSQERDSGSGHSTIKMYDVTANLSGTPAGSPVFTNTYTAQKGGSTGLPAGVCACLSFSAPYGTDVEFGAGGQAIPTPPDIIADYGAAATHLGRTRPRARDRGRIYLGPLLATTVTSEASTFRLVFTSTFVSAVLSAINTLAEVSATGGQFWNLAVWSRRNASVKVANEAWMADRPAYQRRRSDASVIKTFQSLP